MTGKWRERIKVHPAAELIPMMSDAELDELATDIAKHGLYQAVAYHGDELLDGRNRLAAINRIEDEKRRNDLLGFVAATKRALEVRDPIAYVISANVRRRHLTAEQKRGVVAALLKETPARSDRETARLADSNRTTVGQVRRELEQTGDVSIIDTRTDSAGRRQPATRPPKSPNKEAERRAREIPLRAERKAGKLLRAMKKAKGGAQPGIGRAGGMRSDGPTALRDLGISKEQSSNWQKLAEVPEDEFEAALVDPTQTPSTTGIIRSAEEQKQLPRASVGADALWLWGRLLDFERHGLIAREPSDVLLTMTQEMLDDTHTLAPRVATWLQRIGRPLTPPEVETQKGKPLPADGGETSPLMAAFRAMSPSDRARMRHWTMWGYIQAEPAPIADDGTAFPFEQLWRAATTAEHNQFRRDLLDTDNRGGG